jgi:hypothetical protein
LIKGDDGGGAACLARLDPRMPHVVDLDKKTLSERDICTKFITPALVRAGWDAMLQIRENVFFTNGRIILRGKLVTRGKAKFADYSCSSRSFACRLIDSRLIPAILETSCD